MEPTRPILRYFGGKWILAPWIVAHFPPHRIYCEPFGGGASVLLRKPRSYAEVYNDLDGEIVNVFREIRDNGENLIAALRATPFAREEFNASYILHPTPLEQARRTIVRSFMGFGSNANNSAQRTGFRANSNRSNTTAATDWKNYPDCIPAFIERLRGVVIENRDAKDVMLQQDSEETLHFVDPPYVHSTRSEKHGYRHEMSDEDHASLCAFLKSLKGMVILAGYENEIYDELGWCQLRREALADGARERTEVLWLNGACADAQNQLNLFEGAHGK